MNNPYLVCSDRELRTLPTQWLLAERWEKAGYLLYDLNFAEAKTERVGIDELLQDYTTALRLLPKENSWLETLKTINRVLDRQAHCLRGWDAESHPAFLLQQLRNEFLEFDLSELQARSETELAQIDQPYLCERFKVSRESHELVRTLTGHSRVTDVALSADGRLAVSASEDRTLKVWDVATGRELRTIQIWDMATEARVLREHSHPHVRLALSADGQLAVSASIDHNLKFSDDETLKVWDVATGTKLHTLVGHSGGVSSVALSADGRLAVSASSDDNKLIVWDVEMGCKLRTLFEGDSNYNKVRGVAQSADGQLMAASYGGWIQVWEMVTGKLLRRLEGHDENVEELAISADGRVAISTAFATKHYELKVWDIGTGCELQTIVGYRGGVLSADGRVVVSALSEGNTLKVRDVGTGRELHTFIGYSGRVNTVALSRDGSLIVSASSDEIKVWNISLESSLSVDKASNAGVARTDELNALQGHNGSVFSVALSADGRRAISASVDKTLKVWDVGTSRELHTFQVQGYNKVVHGVALSADGQLAAATSEERRFKQIGGLEDKTLKVWDLTTGRELNVLHQRRSERVEYVAMSIDGNWAISLSDGEALEVWDISDLLNEKEAMGRKLCTFAVDRKMSFDSGGLIGGVALNANGRLIVSALADRTLKVWDAATGRTLHTLEGHSDTVRDVVVSRDGRLAISASDDKTLKVWDLARGRELRTLVGHKGDVNNVALSANGQLAISTSRDRTLQVWDVATGQIISTLATRVRLECCAMTPDGKKIVAGDSMGSVHFMELVGNINGVVTGQGSNSISEAILDWGWVDEIKGMEAVQYEKVEMRSGWLPQWLKSLLKKRDKNQG
jgi:WD40 repeat protein